MAEQETSIAVLEYESDHGKVKLSPSIIRRYLVSGKAELVTTTEIVMFMQLCRYQRLNPFLREAYLIKYSPNDPATIVTGKDTFTKRAANLQTCKGYNAGVIVDKGGQIMYRQGAAVFAGEMLLGGWAEVFREGWTQPLRAEVSLSEYVRTNKEGKPNRSWGSMPATMIRKVALVQALREAFPDSYQGLYSPEEMPVEPANLSTEPVDVPAKGEEPTEPTADDAGVDAAFDNAMGKLDQAMIDATPEKAGSE